jgi:hypothetical protein
VASISLSLCSMYSLLEALQLSRIESMNSCVLRCANSSASVAMNKGANRD